MPYHGIRLEPVKPVIFMGRSAHVEPEIEVRMAMLCFYRELPRNTSSPLSGCFWIACASRSPHRMFRGTSALNFGGSGRGMGSLSERIRASGYQTSGKDMGARESPVAAVTRGYPGQSTQEHELFAHPFLRGPDRA